MNSIQIDSAALFIAKAKRVLHAIKDREYDTLASFIHPVNGILFCPYAFIGGPEPSFSKQAFLEAATSQDSFMWGAYDGSGEEIELTVDQYFNEFVYRYDFLNAELSKVDTFIGSGNSLNDLKKIYPNRHFTEHNFSGIDPQYGGMDWGCIRLVFEEYKGKIYLIAIINDQWTI